MDTNTKLSVGPLTIFLPLDVLTKIQTLAAADSRSVENFIVAAAVEKATRADRLELMLDALENASAYEVTITSAEERIEDILARARERGHAHGRQEASE